MNPHSKPRPLFFTPRSPWGRLPLKRAHQSHMRASEDAQTQSGQKRPNLLQRVGSGIASGVKGLGHAIANGHLIGGVEARKDPGDKIDFTGDIGWSMGGGEPSTVEENKKLLDQYTSAQHGQFTNQTNKDKALFGQESTNHVTTDQELAAGQRAWARKNPDVIDKKVETAKAKFQAARASTKG